MADVAPAGVEKSLDDFFAKRDKKKKKEKGKGKEQVTGGSTNGGEKDEKGEGEVDEEWKSGRADGKGNAQSNDTHGLCHKTYRAAYLDSVCRYKWRVNVLKSAMWSSRQFTRFCDTSKKQH